MESNAQHALPSGQADAQVVPVLVWDWPVRLFHWSVVALLVAAVVTAKVGGNAMVWHMRCGFAVLTLVLFRVLWGFFGSRHARFASFLRGPGPIIDYVRSMRRGDHPVSVGHNPLGGWSVVALLAAMLIQTTTGLFANDDIATDGPLVKLISKDLSDTITGFHHRNLWLIGGLVGLHLAAVAWHLFVVKENLVRPMLDGRKHLPRAVAGQGAHEIAHARAIILLGGCAFGVWWLVTRL